MAEAQEPTQSPLDDDGFNLGTLLRMGSWGVGAAAALFLAVLAGMSNPGLSRVDSAVAALSGHTQTVTAAAPSANAPAQPTFVTTDIQPNLETRRLSEQVRLLAADRDRLVQRIAAIEHNLDDVTGSIKRQAAVQAAEAAAPEAKSQTSAEVSVAPPWPKTPQVTTWAHDATQRPEQSQDASQSEPIRTAKAAEVADAAPSATPLPLPQSRPDGEPRHPVAETPEVKRAAEPAKPQAAPAQQHIALAARPQVKPDQKHPAKPEPATGRITYGIDLGGAVSVDRLRMLWNAVRSSQAQTGILKGLRPIAAVREAKAGGRPDLRLVVGPLPTEESATRLCSALLDSGRYCEPTVFRGQRMSGR